MGYVPPAIDNQKLIYGNRQPLGSQLIYVTPSTERINFLDALSSDSDPRGQYNLYKTVGSNRENFNKQNRLEIARKQVEREITGKGNTIDFTV